jgi:hypothetical protein
MSVTSLNYDLMQTKFDGTDALCYAMVPSTILQATGVGLHLLATAVHQRHLELARGLRWGGHKCLEFSAKLSLVGYFPFTLGPSGFTTVAGLIACLAPVVFGGDHFSTKHKAATMAYMFHGMVTGFCKEGLYAPGWENTADNFGMPMNQYLA